MAYEMTKEGIPSNKKWYPVVVNKLNNFTQILYDCPHDSKDRALSFPESSIYSSAIDAIGDLVRMESYEREIQSFNLTSQEDFEAFVPMLSDYELVGLRHGLTFNPESEAFIKLVDDEINKRQEKRVNG